MIPMKAFQHLIIAYDGTKDSKHALDLGISMSKQLQSRLSVVNIQKEGGISHDLTDTDRSGIVPPKTPYVGTMNNYPVVPVAVQQEPPSEHPEYTEQEMALKNEVNRILADQHVDANVEIVYGEPSDEIVQYAQEHDGDLIVIGSRDISGLKRLIFGSVSEKVSHRSTIPVLIAK